MKITYVTTTQRARGVSRITVHSWASNKKRPNIENAQKLGVLYGIPMSSFLTEERGSLWLYIKSMKKDDLQNKLASFFDKQNINTAKHKHNG